MNWDMNTTIENDNDVVSKEYNNSQDARPTLPMSRVMDAGESFSGWGPRVNQTIIKSWN